jgi:transposase-like protein
MKCPECGSSRVDKAGLRYLADGSSVQRFQCRECGFRFSEKANKQSQTNKGNSQICALKVTNLENTAELKTVVGEKERAR